MISVSLVMRRLQEQAMKERMVLDAILILASVEWIQDVLERKLLEFDKAIENNNDGEERRLKAEIRSCLSKLDGEISRMDEYMVKYRRLINEKEKLLSCPVQEKKVYLRGVPPKQIGQT